MNLVTLLVTIQIGVIIAKSIDYKHCKDSPHNDRLKRSGENDTSFNISDVENTDLHNIEEDKPEIDISNDNNDEGHTKEVIRENFHEIDPNTQQNKVVVYIPDNIQDDDVKINNTTARNDDSASPMIYKPVDPKYVITYGPYFIKDDSKNATIGTEDKEGVSIDEKQTIVPKNGAVLFIANDTDLNIDPNKVGDDNIDLDETDTDLTNIREIRVKLLDHLLDYFLNIMNDGDYIVNNTRKDSDNVMDVEDKLRNYYDPEHIDFLIDDDDDEGFDSDYDIDDEYRQIDDDEERSTQDEQNDTFAIKDTVNSDSVEININKNTKNITALENLENLNDKSNLDNHTNSSNNLRESIKVNYALKPLFNNSEYKDLIQKEDNNTLMLNSNEKNIDIHDKTNSYLTVIPKPDLETAEITDNTTGRDISNTIEKVSEKNSYLDDIAIIDDYAYDSKENITSKAEDEGYIPPILGTATDNSRRKVNLHEKDQVSNDTKNKKDDLQNDSDILDNLTSGNLTKIPKNLVVRKAFRDKTGDLKKRESQQHIVNGNININIPCNDVKNDDNLKRNKLMTRINDKSRKNSCGVLFNKGIRHKSIKNNCRKSFVLNLNINLM